VLKLGTSEVWADYLIAQFHLGTARTLNYIWSAFLGECGIAVRVRSTIALRGHGKDMTPATIEWLAAASLKKFASLCNLMVS
jgi:hypothetical protein